MRALDWVIIAVYLVYVLVDGVRRAKGTREIEGYFLANRSLPWWAVGLSVMATQLSAVTLIGTTGQGATDGRRFVQYLWLAIAEEIGIEEEDALAAAVKAFARQVINGLQVRMAHAEIRELEQQQKRRA